MIESLELEDGDNTLRLARLGSLKGMLKFADQIDDDSLRGKTLEALADLGIDVTDETQIPTLLDEAIHEGQTTQLLSELSILTQDGADKNRKRINEILSELDKKGVEPPKELAA